MRYYYVPCELMTFDLIYSSKTTFNHVWHHFEKEWGRYYGRIPDEFSQIPDSTLLLLGVKLT